MVANIFARRYHTVLIQISPLILSYHPLVSRTILIRTYLVSDKVLFVIDAGKTLCSATPHIIDGRQYWAAVRSELWLAQSCISTFQSAGNTS